MTPLPRDTSAYQILMIAPTSFFSDYGCHVRILEEARILQQLGQKVTIATYYKGRDLPELEIVRTRPVPWRADYEVGSSRHKIAFDLLLSWTSLKLAVRRPFHLVHAHLHEGALIGSVLTRLKRVPLVLDFQGSMTAEMVDHRFLNPEGRWYQPVHWIETQINRLPQAILTSSHHAASLLQREFSVNPSLVHAVPDAVNLGFFQPDCLSPAEKLKWKMDLGIPLDRPIIAYLGLLTDYQGIDKLLQAAAELNRREIDVHFLIMGYPNVVYYRQMATEFGLGQRVTFTGKVPYEFAPRYLALGDIAVAPKISDTEGSGKILNYMAMGLPTVAFDVPVSREFLGRLGVYAEPASPRSLANALQSLLSDSERSKELSPRLRQKAASDYSWEQAGLDILAIYDQLLHTASTARISRGATLTVSSPKAEHPER
jgi:glycosyltransferase involved in cell wall biosynthesis